MRIKKPHSYNKNRPCPACGGNRCWMTDLKELPADAELKYQSVRTAADLSDDQIIDLMRQGFESAGFHPYVEYIPDHLQKPRVVNHFGRQRVVPGRTPKSDEQDLLRAIRDEDYDADDLIGISRGFGKRMNELRSSTRSSKVRGFIDGSF